MKWAWILGAGIVGYVVGVQKQRSKDEREIMAAGAEGEAFAKKLGTLRSTMTTKSQGLAADARMFLALDEPLTGKGSTS